MLAFDWRQQSDKFGCNILPARMTCVHRVMLPDCSGTLFLTLCQISALKVVIGEYIYDNTIFLKWGILNVQFCAIFVPFHFHLILTMVNVGIIIEKKCSHLMHSV